MKNNLLLIFFMLTVISVFAQRRGGEIKWLSLAVKGGYGNSVFLHRETMEDKNVSMDYKTPSFCFGGRFGITYGNRFGVSVEYLQSSFGQKYSIRPTATAAPYDKEIKMKSTDICVLFRYTGDYGLYVELGPKYTKLKSAEQTSSVVLTDPYNQPDIIDKYVTSFPNLVFGLGYMALRTERVTGSLGLRASYSFQSIVTDQTYFAVKDNKYSPTYYDPETKLLQVQLMAELNYFFGFWGDASCGKGRIMFFK